MTKQLEVSALTPELVERVAPRWLAEMMATLVEGTVSTDKAMANELKAVWNALMKHPLLSEVLKRAAAAERNGIVPDGRYCMMIAVSLGWMLGSQHERDRQAAQVN